MKLGKLYPLAVTILSLVLIFTYAFPTQSAQTTLSLYQQTSTSKPIQIHQRSLVISERLQLEIADRIPALDRQIQEQFKLFAIPINREIGLVYLHQGRQDWKIKFTYGGYSIDTTDETVYTSQEIFKLKQAFTAISTITIAGRTYDTNGSMRQLGPILHDLAAES
jgi:hypothetical protein